MVSPYHISSDFISYPARNFQNTFLVTLGSIPDNLSSIRGNFRRGISFCMGYQSHPSLDLIHCSVYLPHYATRCHTLNVLKLTFSFLRGFVCNTSKLRVSLSMGS